MTLEELHKLILTENLAILSENRKVNPQEFALKNSKHANIPVRTIAEQIDCHLRAEKKIPEFSDAGLLYDRIAIEQCSGESAAKFKAKLLSGEKIIDLTGGLGIDIMYLAANFDEAHYCEQNEVLYEIAEHNFEALGKKNIKRHSGNSLEILKTFPDNYFDWIYLDPARRDKDKRYIALENCEPNLMEILPLLKQKSSKICIKLAPAFDLTEAMRKISGVSELYAVEASGEVKEVLAIIKPTEDDEVFIRAAVLGKNEDIIIEKSCFDKFCTNISEKIGKYFYEPSPAIIKANLSDKIAFENNLELVNNNCDYLTGDNFADTFTGRIFEVKEVFNFKIRDIQQYLNAKGITKVNIASRNFPLKPEQIRKDFKVGDGGDNYLFFTKDSNEKHICIVCKKK